MLSHIGHTILGMNSVQLYMKIPGCRTPGIYPFEYTLATSFLKKVMSSLQGEKKRIIKCFLVHLFDILLSLRLSGG